VVAFKAEAYCSWHESYFPEAYDNSEITSGTFLAGLSSRFF